MVLLLSSHAIASAMCSVYTLRKQVCYTLRQAISFVGASVYELHVPVSNTPFANASSRFDNPRLAISIFLIPDFRVLLPLPSSTWVLDNLVHCMEP